MPSVVSYSISTSNHNRVDAPVSVPFVVSYSISTSNHNLRSIFCFAIIVVSYSISTSNHNSMLGFTNCVIVVSYSISTSNHNITHYLLHIIEVVSYSISTSNHNIGAKIFSLVFVVSYSISTSNHNLCNCNARCIELYLIPFLHQTTTFLASLLFYLRCILFHFYIKPQPRYYDYKTAIGCILFHFYIKPQRKAERDYQPQVVSYSISTSNHNLWRIRRYFQAHYHLNHILIFNGML